MKIAQADIEFVYKLMERFEVKAIDLRWSNSKKKWPDIWVLMKKMPVIYVTVEWARQTETERQKRLTHEFIHLTGLEHGQHEGLTYSTHPDKDEYSRMVYRKLTNPRIVFDSKFFGGQINADRSIIVGGVPGTNIEKHTILGHEIGHDQTRFESKSNYSIKQFRTLDSFKKYKNVAMTQYWETFMDEVRAWDWILTKSKTVGYNAQEISTILTVYLPPMLNKKYQKVRQDAIEVGQKLLNKHFGKNPIEPWQMTQSEYVKWDQEFTRKGFAGHPGLMPDIDSKQFIEHDKYAHMIYVEDALSEGKTVPAKVLKDYPDLLRRS